MKQQVNLFVLLVHVLMDFLILYLAVLTLAKKVNLDQIVNSVRSLGVIALIVMAMVVVFMSMVLYIAMGHVNPVFKIL